MSVADQQVAYVTERGSFSSADHTTDEGLLTLMFIRCPGDEKMRVGVWIAEDPDPDRAVDELEIVGTVADPNVVRELLSGFRTCEG